MIIVCLDIYQKLKHFEKALVRGNDPFIYEDGYDEPLCRAMVNDGLSETIMSWDEIDANKQVSDSDGNIIPIGRDSKYRLYNDKLPIVMGILRALSANHQAATHPQGWHINNSLLKDEPNLLILEPDVEEYFNVGMKYPLDVKLFKEIEKLFMDEVVPIIEAEWPILTRLYVTNIVGLPTVVLKGEHTPMEERYLNITTDLKNGSVEIIST